ncbi:uncharacterized protein L3040_002857 [Drepanopeziza brunnea f. sp. 'multigermtubi']|uniref:Impact family protein n=1 Tax=Marssonina brunnea f. sp. multigermtubi (strain MB_m1) TaxID=1072389 RepID=K1WBL5_MARBU|nr:impact family protein [Drepanopeziza brunnea f. sp. 'multigermtubi' MB_m1]EKD14715.1 impact family protein [Drepanopeziza brunnea f. sp. 'multigermtubi' MB_m1]KAJ5050990.1 hypothetical protein L3040_002857 [Drepanopeziza brunnea f. sp. 'multigermtubi']
MNEDIRYEIEAINSIYGPDSLVPAPTTTTTTIGTGKDENGSEIYILHIPSCSLRLRIQLPLSYPASSPPAIVGVEGVGTVEGGKDMGKDRLEVDVWREVLARVFRPGEVCLFDFVEEVAIQRGGDEAVLNMEVEEDVEEGEAEEEEEEGIEDDAPFTNHDVADTDRHTTDPSLEIPIGIGMGMDLPPPCWTLSAASTVHKSIFLARCAPVSTGSPATAQRYLAHLLASDKKVRAATHNISAWRIRGPPNSKNSSSSLVTYQDFDDDGETAAGARLLHLMRLMDVWDVMVVVTRWYGGVKLGGKRFSVINAVAREALVKGGFGSGGVSGSGVMMKEEGKEVGRRKGKR